MHHVEIRRPQRADFTALTHFFDFVVKDTFVKEGIAHLVEDSEQEIKTKIDYLHQDLNSNGETRYFLMALIQDKIVGTIEFGPASELISNCTNGELREIAEVGTVFVHPEHQRQGVGSLLLNTMYITLLSRGIEEFCLDSGYSAAQKVWQKKFGKPSYHLLDYWGEGHDHMIWKRRLIDIQIRFTI